MKKEPIIEMIEKIDEINKKSVFVSCIAFMVMLGTADYISGHIISFMPFYFIPIAILAWFVNRNAGLVGSVLAVIFWIVIDNIYNIDYLNPVVPYWSAFNRLFFYVIVTLLLSALGLEMKKQKKMASTDYLTKLDNRRSFMEKMHIEIQRAIRTNYPVTMVYFDVDDFKRINDKFGHDVGDAVLVSTASIMKKSIRITDIAARLGGDEFAMFLPDMDCVEAKKFVMKMRKKLQKGSGKNRKRATFSFGVSCYKKVGKKVTAEQLIKKSDKIMYTVKRKGKNAVLFEEM